MPAYEKSTEQQTQSSISQCIAVSITILLNIASPALASNLVNRTHTADSSRFTITSEVDDDSRANRAQLAAVAAPIAHTTLVEGTGVWTTTRVLKEVGKQAIDQPGHFLIGAAPIWAARYLVGVPWLGWVAAPILAYREWLQWPSKRWWDPPLDWAFLTLGAVAATWGRRPRHGMAGPYAAMRQRAALGLAIHDRMRHAG